MRVSRILLPTFRRDANGRRTRGIQAHVPADRRREPDLSLLGAGLAFQSRYPGAHPTHQACACFASHAANASR